MIQNIWVKCKSIINIIITFLSSLSDIQFPWHSFELSQKKKVSGHGHDSMKFKLEVPDLDCKQLRFSVSFSCHLVCNHSDFCNTDFFPLPSFLEVCLILRETACRSGIFFQKLFTSFLSLRESDRSRFAHQALCLKWD